MVFRRLASTLTSVSFLTLIAGFLVCALLPAALEAAPDGKRVVASIVPLKTIVDSLAGDLAQTEVIIEGNTSPHHQALKPSHLRRIRQADMVLWVGPELEGFMQKVLENEPAIVSLGMSEVKDIHWLKKGRSHVSHQQGQSRRERGNPHLWLDLHNVQLYAAEISKWLIREFPEQRPRLEQRLARFEDQLQQIKRQTTEGFAKSNSSFIAFHDGLRYYVSEYSLDQAAILMGSSERKPGVRKIAELKASLRNNTRCLLADGNEVVAAKRYSPVLGIPVVEIDLLGQAREYEGFVDYYLALGSAVQRCMQQGL